MLNEMKYNICNIIFMLFIKTRFSKNCVEKKVFVYLHIILNNNKRNIYKYIFLLTKEQINASSIFNTQNNEQ